MKDSSSVRIGSVDALRALAILPVLLFHLRPAWLPGGYLGVDVFFVLSGFLITGILLRETEAGVFSFTGFYVRRIRRILPALFVMLATVVLACAWVSPLGLNEVVRQAQSVVVLLGNVTVRALAGDYWGGVAQEQPLLHTWSLGVEEQFYLGFPLLLWIFCRWGVRLSLAFGLIAAASLGLYLVQAFVSPTAAFYLLGGRAWELLAGALVAVVARGEKGPSPWSEWRPWAGLLLVAAAYVLPAFLPVLRPFLPLVTVAGAALFLSAPPSSRAHGWISRPWLIYVGLISYSLYLWHWPAVVLVRPAFQTVAVWADVVLLAGIFLVAAVSYHAVEKPMQKARWTTWAMLACVPLILIGGGALARARGRPPILASADPAADRADEWVGGFRGMTVRGTLFSSNPREITEVADKYRSVRFVRRPGPVAIDARVSGGDPRGDRRALFWGDSHAMMLAPAVDDVFRRIGLSAEYHVLDGADPAVRRARRFGASPSLQWARRVFRDDKIATSDELDLFEAKGLRLLADRPAVCVLALRYDRRDFETTAASIKEMLDYSKLVLVQQPPSLKMPDFCTVDYFAFQRDRRGLSLRDITVVEAPEAKAARRDFEERLIRRFGRTPGFVFVRTDDLFLRPDGTVRWWDGAGALYYIDNNHLSEFGTRLVAPRVEEAVCGLLNGSH